MKLKISKQNRPWHTSRFMCEKSIGNHFEISTLIHFDHASISITVGSNTFYCGKRENIYLSVTLLFFTLELDWQFNSKNKIIYGKYTELTPEMEQIGREHV